MTIEVERDPVGVVLGSQDATPLELWIGVRPEKIVQLDDLVVVRSELPDGSTVRYYGVVDQVRKRFEVWGRFGQTDVDQAG